MQSPLGSTIACIAGAAVMVGAIWVGPASLAGIGLIAALLACGVLWGAVGCNEHRDHDRTDHHNDTITGRRSTSIDTTLSHLR